MDRTLSGKRIELIRMEDPYTNLKEGDKGTIQFIDDIGQIHVKWDNGSTLSIVPEIDEYDIIEESLNKLNYVKLFEEFVCENFESIKIKDTNSLIGRQPEMLKDCEIELLEEKVKTKGEKYKKSNNFF